MPEHPVLGRFFIFYSAPSKYWKNAEIMTGIDLLCPKEKSLRARFLIFALKTHFFEKNFKKLPKLVMWEVPVLAKIEKNEKISAKSLSDEGGFNLFYSNMGL